MQYYVSVKAFADIKRQGIAVSEGFISDRVDEHVKEFVRELKADTQVPGFDNFSPIDI